MFLPLTSSSSSSPFHNTVLGLIPYPSSVWHWWLSEAWGKSGGHGVGLMFSTGPAFTSKVLTGRICGLGNTLSCFFATKAIGFWPALEHNTERGNHLQCSVAPSRNSSAITVDISYSFLPAYWNWLNLIKYWCSQLTEIAFSGVGLWKGSFIV